MNPFGFYAANSGYIFMIIKEQFLKGFIRYYTVVIFGKPINSNLIILSAMIQYLVMKLLTIDSCSPIVLLIGNWELIRCQCILIGFSLFILIRLTVTEP